MLLRAGGWFFKGIALLGALYAFQLPFREYPGVEYRLGEIPLPADWRQPSEWTFARLMYPPAPGRYGRGFGYGYGSVTAVRSGPKATPCGPRTIRAPTGTSRWRSAA